ncbi:MAG: antibiotic biosynthesis monooxygenase [Phycisphaerales bacterium]|nr:antibiotic biosynthesis monooxygenase [Phycisphaerales bacterium]
MTTIELHLRIRVKPGGREALLSFLREAVPFYESPGGITMRLLEDHDDPDRFVEVVEYASERAYQDDQRRVEHDEKMKSYLKRWRNLLAEPPAVEVFGVVPRTSIKET